MMSALELAEAGLTVSVFDKGQAGKEASGLVVELFRHYTRGGMHSITALATWSQAFPDLIASLSEATGIDSELSTKECW